MTKITGIKSVDFKIKAYGHGVVNWNGPTTLQNEGRIVDNHTLPKLRGYTNLTGKKSDKGYSLKKEPTDIDFKKTPLYISQNCIRHHLFRDQAFDLHFAKENIMDKVLPSITGLIRGFVVPKSGNKRTSPLLIEDFVDQLGNGNFEQMGRSGSKEKEKNKKGEQSSNSFFSKTTFGDTEYISYGSISVEQLQFISLDRKFDRAAMFVTDAKSNKIKGNHGEEVAHLIQEFIISLNEDTKLTPEVKFHPNYVRKGTIFNEGEVGFMLNNDAVQATIEYTLEMIRNLSIRQAKSYMYVDEIMVDYNDSTKMMRIKRDEDAISKQPQSDYAAYFKAEDKSEKAA